MARAGAADRPGPGHLSDHDQDAFRAAREGRARLFLLRLLVRLCHLRGRHRSVLGAEPCARIPELASARRLPKGSRQPRARTPPASVGPSCIPSIPTNADLAELRSMQDWYLKYQLTSVEGVAEVASVGGFVKQYQVTVDPTKLRAYNLSIARRRAWPSRRATAKSAGAPSRWRKRNSSCACAATCKPRRFAERSPWASARTACRSCWARSPTCNSVRTCGAASPN